MPSRPNLPPPEFPRPPQRKYAGTRADAARWVRDVLRNQILDGVYGGLAAARPALPPELTLAEQLGVSRNAIREALDLLRAEGLVTRVQGAGTFVTGAKLRQHLGRLEGLAESLAGHHLPVDNKVLSVCESTATGFVAAKLGVAEGSPILFVERLRSVGGVPLSLDTSSLRPEAIQVLQDADLVHDDVFSLIERELGVSLGWAENTIESVAADAETARYLQTRTGSPLLLLHRLTYLEDGTPFDLESIRYRGDRFCLVSTTLRSAPS
ncbi:MAG: GntR family transcriptional regulator [Mycobacterium sp.]